MAHPLEQPYPPAAGELRGIERSLPRDPVLLMAIGAVADALANASDSDNE